jgi:microsomal dipeptidase-like Zn-dependent dipeptidase
MPEELSAAEKVPVLYEYLLTRKISEETINAIMFDNAFKFFKDNLR